MIRYRCGVMVGGSSRWLRASLEHVRHPCRPPRQPHLRLLALSRRWPSWRTRMCLVVIVANWTGSSVWGGGYAAFSIVWMCRWPGAATVSPIRVTAIRRWWCWLMVADALPVMHARQPRACQEVCVSGGSGGHCQVRPSRPGKWISKALSARFHPQVPVPKSPPRLSLMLRAPRRSSFNAASSVGK